MNIKFKKYHGLGNDYLVIDPNVQKFDISTESIRLICHRNFGVGSDGILYGPITDNNNFNLRIFNPDGSEAEKSGNGLRIFAKYLFENNYVSTNEFNIETKGGIVDVEIINETANMIKINMGKVTFVSNEIPVKGPSREVVSEELTIDQTKYKVTCASIGNPHCVILMDEINEQKARLLGPYVENHEMFPNRINMQLLKIIDKNTIQIEIWERGAGYTLASGSSSCAAAAAAHKMGLVANKINVKMLGGNLLIEIDDNQSLHMTGPVEGVFEGTFHKDLIKKIAGAGAF